MYPIQTILHPTDFSEPADHAFRLAGSLARERGARLLVLHVVAPAVEGIPRPGDYVERTWEELRGITAPVPGVRLEHLLVEGDPCEEIPRVAVERGCDLIVMGTHSWARGDRLLMGSVAREVFSRAPCQLLITRPPFPSALPVSAAREWQEAPGREPVTQRG